MSGLKVVKGSGEGQQCVAATKKGARCRKRAVYPGDKCLTHMGVIKKTALTKETADAVVELLQEGIVLATAIALSGVPERTFYDWMEADRTADGDTKTLRERVTLARAEGEAANLRGLRRAAKEKDDWRGFDRLLQLQNPEVYGRTPTTAAPAAGEGDSPDGKASDQAGL